MKTTIIIGLSLLCVGLAKSKPYTAAPCTGPNCEKEASDFLKNVYEKGISEKLNQASLASWGYNTDLKNKAAEELATSTSIALANYVNAQYKEHLSRFDWKSFPSDSLVRRQLQFLSSIGTAALPERSLARYNDVLAEMSRIYSTAKVCPYKKPDCNLEDDGLALDPELENIIATSKDYDELTYAWKSWRDYSGKLMRQLYSEYIDLGNEASVLNGFTDLGAFWIRMYESPEFRKDIDAIWQDVKELYLELHAYVRYRLEAKFPDQVKPGEPIPAHVLGNMWAQTWDGIYLDVVPFKDAPIFDVTEALKKKHKEDHSGVFEMFEVANEFFVSLGLEDMKMSYGPRAMLVKPKDKEVTCHASAWDFSDGEDYRVKMCTGVNMEDFITIHHELGHIQYFIQYKDLPAAFREGANPGFHEAIGDVVALSVATPKHMEKLGYLEGAPPSYESTINYLMKMALDKVAFLPFGYMIDAYRWSVFDGTFARSRLTYNWLKMRSDYQGVVPPVTRDENDFDPGAKYHVPGDTPYIRYFVSFILQFQIHQALCQEAGEYEAGNPEKPLHQCDIYQNEAAGEKFKQILKSGVAKNWQDLLEEVVGQRKIDAGPIKEYFAPLTAYLVEQREQHGYTKGWRSDAFEDFYKL